MHIIDYDNVTLDFIIKNPQYDWNYKFITQKFLENWEMFVNIPIPWSCEVLSTLDFINIKIVNENPNIPWDWSELSSNPNITIDDIESTPYHPWNKRYISYNDNLTIEYVSLKNKYPWNWEYLSSHFDEEDKKKYPNLPWASKCRL